jgi:predicted ATPase
MPRLSIALLGALRVTLGGEPVTGFATDKARALLAYLAVEADHFQRRDALAGLLWPDVPQQKARRNLRQALSFLRQALAGDRPTDGSPQPFILATQDTVQFDAASDHWLDAAALEALAGACHRHRHRRLEACMPCAGRMRQMVDLYRGDFLEQFFLSDSETFEEWAALYRERYRRLVLEALSALAAHDELRGNCRQAREYAWRLVALEPWHEEAHRRLMRLLAIEGQRGAALAQFEACRRTLEREFGVEPTAETTALYEQIRDGADIPCVTPSSNLPPPSTPFVGRQQELSELADLLADPDVRLLALAGPGGIGKTRLALQAAEGQIGLFADGVCLVELASVPSAELVVPAIAVALGFAFDGHQDPGEQLLNYLAEKELLLVLDNLEHVLEAGDLLVDILRRAPGVVLLVTSRERLNLRKERVYEVSGLSYPENGGADGRVAYGAVDLFYECAQRADPRVRLSGSEQEYVVRICQLVEGMPLGVELAAAWTRVYACGEIAQALESSFEILATRLRDVPARHRSIRASFEHSWRLLDGVDRDLLARLSVFRGGFDEQAAAEVGGASTVTLLGLLDKSLIRRVAAGRYDVHELLRQYAMEKLSLDAEAFDQARLQHARHYLALLARQEGDLESAAAPDAIHLIAQEGENIRQAWQTAVTHGLAPEVQQSLKSLYGFYDIQCRFQEGIDLLKPAIERWQGDGQRMDLYAQALSRQGALCRHLGRYREARSCLEQSLAVAERLAHRRAQIFCLVHLADVARRQGNREVEQLAQRGLDLAIEIDDPWGRASSLFFLGLARYRAGDVEQAQVFSEESLDVGRRSGNPRLAMSPLNLLADIACHRGDYARAQRMFEECLVLSRALDDRFSAAVHLNNLGTVFHQWSRLTEAQSYYQQSLGICRAIGDRAGQSIALSNLGEVAFALGIYQEAQTCYQGGLAIGRDIRDRRTVMVCLTNLGEIAHVLGDLHRARRCLREAIELAWETHGVPVLIKALVNLAALFAGRGQAERAVELLGLARQHPACAQETREKIERLLSEFNLVLSDLPPRPLEVVVTETLESLSA